MPRRSRIDRKWRSIIRLTPALGGSSSQNSGRRLPRGAPWNGSKAQIAAVRRGCGEWVNRPKMKSVEALAGSSRLGVSHLAGYRRTHGCAEPFWLLLVRRLVQIGVIQEIHFRQMLLHCFAKSGKVGSAC